MNTKSVTRHKRKVKDILARGELAIKTGRVLSHGSAKKRMERWLKLGNGIKNELPASSLAAHSGSPT
jgi:hypothetical protein